MKYIIRHWGLLFLVAVWLLFSYPYFVKGLVPFPSRYLVTFFPPWSASYGMPVKNNAMPDVITQIYPWKKTTIDTWKLAEVPLWNPNSFSGTKLAGNYQSAVFSPINILFFILPHIDAWSIMILLQPLLAGICMYLFLRSLDLSREGSVAGSLAFMFCGFITVWMAYGTLAYAVLFLPLALFAVNSYRKGRVWAAPLLSISLALSFLSGHFQMSIYVLGFTVLYIIYAYRTGKNINPWILFSFVCAGLALAAPQIFPSLTAYESSGRSSNFGKGEIIPWSYLITVFSPDFYGNPVTRNDWFGHYAEWASFVGVAPLVFSYFALVYRRHDKRIWFFAGAAFLCLLLATPTFLNDAMYALHIPVLSTSSASRIIILVSFCLATLAAIGIDAIPEFWDKRKKLPWMFLLTAMLFISGVWIWLKFLHSLPAEKMVVAVRNSYLPTLFLIVSAGIIALGSKIPKRFRKLLVFVIIICTAIDMFRYASKWMPFDPKEYVYPKMPVITYLTDTVKPTHARIIGNIFNEVNSTFGLPSLEGYDAVYQQRYGEFISAATDGSIKPLGRSVVSFDKRGIYAEDIARLLGAKYLVHRLSDAQFGWAYPYWEFPSYHSVWKDNTYEVFENAEAYPRAFLASSYIVRTTKESILEALFAKDTNRRDTLVLEKKPNPEPKSGDGKAVITEYHPTKVVIEVNTRVPKLVFLSDVYDEGWHATIDGKDASIYRADYDFRALAVSAGTHRIVMWYWPTIETWGFIMAGFGTLWCIGYVLIRKRL